MANKVPETIQLQFLLLDDMKGHEGIISFNCYCHYVIGQL
jgi:hypothetical protein